MSTKQQLNETCQSFVPPALDDSVHLTDLNRSLRDYAKPSQALIFLDWDDTLFPTSYLRAHFEYPWDRNNRVLRKVLEECGEALATILDRVCHMSARCVILTLAEPGWIENCCLPLFDSSIRNVWDGILANDPDRLRIVYADRGYTKCFRWLQCFDSCKSMVGSDPDSVDRARLQRYVNGKQRAMTREASAFYSRYPNQSWKNILSIGDSMYEFIAMQRLGSFRRAKGGKERHLRSKVVRLQTEPSIITLTWQLRLLDELMPALMRHDGCLNLNIPDALDPLHRIAQALAIPQIVDMHPLRCIWDEVWDANNEEYIFDSLKNVRKIVEEKCPVPSEYSSISNLSTITPVSSTGPHTV